MDVDLLVIGWGKAGKTLAGRYAAAGHSVALVERSPKMYGGTCINIACVPTKDLVVSAEQRRESDDPAEYFAQSVAGRDALISKLNAANHKMLEKPNVTLIDGTARFVGPHEVSIYTADGEVNVTASKIIVGTGATPARLPIPGLTASASTTRRPSSTSSPSRSVSSSSAEASWVWSSRTCSPTSARR